MPHSSSTQRHGRHASTTTFLGLPREEASSLHLQGARATTTTTINAHATQTPNTSTGSGAGSATTRGVRRTTGDMTDTGLRSQARRGNTVSVSHVQRGYLQPRTMPMPSSLRNTTLQLQGALASGVNTAVAGSATTPAARRTTDTTDTGLRSQARRGTTSVSHVQRGYSHATSRTRTTLHRREATDLATDIAIARANLSLAASASALRRGSELSQRASQLAASTSTPPLPRQSRLPAGSAAAHAALLERANSALLAARQTSREHAETLRAARQSNREHAEALRGTSLTARRTARNSATMPPPAAPYRPTVRSSTRAVTPTVRIATTNSATTAATATTPTPTPTPISAPRIEPTTTSPSSKSATPALAAASASWEGAASLRGTLRELQRQQGETLRELERLRLEQLNLRRQQQTAIFRLLESERMLLARAAPDDEAATDASWLDDNLTARTAVLDLLSHAAASAQPNATQLSWRWDALEGSAQRAALAHAARLLEASLSRLDVQLSALNAGRPAEAERALPPALVDAAAPSSSDSAVARAAGRADAAAEAVTRLARGVLAAVHGSAMRRAALASVHGVFGDEEDAAPRGASSEAIASLAETPFGAGADDASCAICLRDFETPDCLVVRLPKCSHAFHKGCISEWLCIRNACPLCKAKACVT